MSDADHIQRLRGATPALPAETGCSDPHRAKQRGEARRAEGPLEGNSRMTRLGLKSPAVRGVALLATAVVTLGLSACAGGDDSADEGGLTTIRVATAGMLPTYEDLVWGIEGGFFEDQGLNVEMTPPLYATDALNAVMNDDADMSITTATLAASARSVGRPVTVVATSQSPYPLEITFTDEADADLRAQGLSEASDIGEFLEALKGLTLGTSPVGSSINSTFRFLLEERGINPEQDGITLQAMPDAAAQVASLSNDRVDGLVCALGGACTGAEAQGTGVTWSLAELAGADSLEQIPYCNIITSEAMISSDPEAVQAFLDGLHEAQQSLRQGITAEDDAALKELLGSEMDPTVYANTTATTRELFKDDFTTSEASWELVQSVAEVTSEGPLDVPFEEAVDNTFAEKVG